MLACAIKCGANAIVTTNLGDFPDSELAKFNIVAIHQDDFVMDQLGLSSESPGLVASAIVAHKKSLKKSRTTWKQYFEVMSRPGVGLRNSYSEISSPEFRSLLSAVLRSKGWMPD